MKIKKIPYSELRTSRYQELFIASEVSTPFHSLDWLDLIIETNAALRLELVVISDNHQEIAFLPYFTKMNWPSFWMFMPHWAYSGFIYEKLNETILFDFLRKNSFTNYFTCMVIFEGELYKTLPYLHGIFEKYSSWILETTNTFEDMMSAIPSKTRNQIRKAFKEGVTYKKIETKQELEEIKQIYSMLVLKHNIQSPYPSILFDELYKLSLKGGNISFNIAKYDDQVIAYSVFLMSRKQVFYWLNASISDYSSLNATNGILSLMIQACCKDNEVKFINFGAVPYGNDGLMHFKKNWGTTEVKYGYYDSTIKHMKERLNAIMGK